MLLANVKKGMKVAIPQKHGDPRQAEVRAIVSVEDRVYSYIREEYEVRNVRRVLVKMLDNGGGGFGEAKKGANATVEARVLVPWKEVGPGIKARIEREEKQKALSADAEKRIKKLLGRNYDGYVTCSLPRGVNLDVWGKSLTKLLDLAEYGRIKKIEEGK